MPIVLNGSGTVTGISVGGLPDGIVDGDTLASGVGGKVLQSVTASTTTQVETTSTTYTDTGLTASITISASSKVLVLVSQDYEIKRGPHDSCFGDIKLVRASTDIYVSANQKLLGFNDLSSDNKSFKGVLSLSFLDTGASTGSNTYKTMMRVQTADNGGNMRTQDDSNPSVITLLEIAA
tara:strand:+ start:60 stop:596 length:537 start_codon:yes stop_codon:yes gene_type:complete